MSDESIFEPEPELEIQVAELDEDAIGAAVGDNLRAGEPIPVADSDTKGAVDDVKTAVDLVTTAVGNIPVPPTASAIGIAVIGTPEDAPSAAVEDVTTRSITSLLKNISNWLRTLTLGLTMASSVSTPTVQVDAASVAANTDSVVASTATGGKRWVTVNVICIKPYTLKLYGHTAAFSSLAACKLIATLPGKEATPTGGESFDFFCPSRAHVAAVLHNDDAVNAATGTTVDVSFYD